MPKTLLLADDSVTIQKVVGISFANEDIVLSTVDNGDDAIAGAREAARIVLADVVMPGKNGYEVCEAIKADPNLRHIRCCCSRARSRLRRGARAARVGADGHITKPFEAQALVDRVKQLLASSAAALVRPAPARPSPPLRRRRRARTAAAPPRRRVRLLLRRDAAARGSRRGRDRWLRSRGARGRVRVRRRRPPPEIARAAPDTARRRDRRAPARSARTLRATTRSTSRSRATPPRSRSTDRRGGAGRSGARLGHSTLLDPDAASAYDVSVVGPLGLVLARPPRPPRRALGRARQRAGPGRRSRPRRHRARSVRDAGTAPPRTRARARCVRADAFERDAFDPEPVAFDAEPVMMGEPLAEELAIEPAPAPFRRRGAPATTPFVAPPAAEDPFEAEPWDDDDSFPGPRSPSAPPAAAASGRRVAELRAELRDTLEKIAWDAFGP